MEKKCLSQKKNYKSVERSILWNNDNGDKFLPQKKNYESAERFKKKSGRKLI